MYIIIRYVHILKLPATAMLESLILERKILQLNINIIGIHVFDY